MKNLVSLLSLLFVTTLLPAQDTLFTRTGDTLLVKVAEIHQEDVGYRKPENPDGPVYFLSIRKVLRIVYANGITEEFTGEATVLRADSITAIYSDGNDELIGGVPGNDALYFYRRGESDARRYYRGYKQAATVTLVSSLFFSPFVGIPTAIVCSTTSPKESTLNYPSPELYRQPDYALGYNAKAKKMKAGKVWANWAIITGCQTIMILMLSMWKAP